jgi:uncharacterized protein YjdB
MASQSNDRVPRRNLGFLRLGVIALTLALPEFFLSACGDGSTGPGKGPTVASVSVTPPTSTIVSLGETVQLSAQAKDAQGNAISGKTFAWLSSNQNVAAVSATGLVTAVGNGSATITATVDGVAGSASITVAQQAASLVLSPTSLVLGGPGDTATVNATVRDAGGSAVAGAAFAWASDDESIAVVSGVGLVTAVAAGTATITVEATSGSQTLTEDLPVTVNEALEITTTTLPSGVLNEAYSHTLNATGGEGNYAWSIAGGSLPEGLSLNNGTGQISGTPTMVETQTFTVQVTSGDDQTAQRSLSITVSQSQPGISIFSEDFEGGWGSWSASNGIWGVGLPSSGPSGCHSGVQCAGTVLNGDYPDNHSSLVSPTLTLPAIGANEEIHLRFWHWFSFSSYFSALDRGIVYVEERISAGVWGEWTELARFSGGSGGVWTYPLVDLSSHGGKTVRIRFELDGEHSPYTSSGWYIDDVSVSVVQANHVLPYADDFESGVGNWWASNGSWGVDLPTSGPNGCYSGVQCAGTVLNGDYPDNHSSLVSPTLTLPAIGANEEIHLRFWHWFSFSSYFSALDRGIVYVEERISAGVWGEWTELARFSGGSGGVWTYPLVDLSSHGGKTVRIRFELDGEHSPYTSSGWYIDDVSVVVVGSNN